MKIVGKKTRRVDGLSLAKGKAVFADDMSKKDYLYAKILHSPIAHGKIVSIDKSKALALDGIEIILTHEDFTPHYFTTAGQGYPEPSPRDTVMFNKTMRFVGDRVAVVAGESLEVVEEALALIDVEYEELPTIFDMGDSIDNDTVIHPGKDGFSFLHDASRNIAANISEELGDVQKGFNDSDYVFEGTYFTPYAQQCSIEPHITLTWLDENDRLIIRTATQVPYHVRRVVAEILDIPVGKFVL
jgi:putative selenate reductase molybdopterin-binding subunit